MKKLISLLVCAVFLFACAAAAADTDTLDISNRIQLKGSLPAGYKLSILSQTDLTLEGSIESGDPAAPVMTLFISFNESYAAVKDLNDLGNDDLDLIKNSFTEEYTVAFDQFETAAGARMLFTRENSDGPDFLDFYTVFLGHEIELTLLPGTGDSDQAFTEDEISRCKEYVKTLELIPLQ